LTKLLLVQITNIAAAELDTLQRFNISGTELRYSALDYAKAVAVMNPLQNPPPLLWIRMSCRLAFNRKYK